MVIEAIHSERSPATATAERSLAALWRALEAVPDPEIPVVSVVELGIVRSLEWDAADPATLVVRVTPTYSGCPATEVISTDIRAALMAAGAPRVRLEIQLAPAWTTDWIAPDARTKLREYGIVPPVASGAVRIDISGLRSPRRAPEIIACPRCGSERTRVLSQFGSTACKAQYRCNACLEPFDYFKPH
ncbi:MAG: 1,2-phenylacetyl-CoA epoxidase subunit PaaD [Casimicrobiaceae bacterium]